MLYGDIMHYPAGVKKVFKNQKVYSNRGMNLEDDINYTNEYYLNTNIAIIYKKPTPITIVDVDYKSRKDAIITKAFFRTPSTTDYNGLYKGKYIDFEAKETRNKTSFPLQNLHKHQIEHLMSIIKHGGIGFLIVYFTTLEKTFLLDAKIVHEHYISKINSIPLSVFEEKGHVIEEGYVLPLDYLKCVNKIYFNE